jgi:hypothetical protein
MRAYLHKVNGTVGLACSSTGSSGTRVGMIEAKRSESIFPVPVNDRVSNVVLVKCPQYGVLLSKYTYAQH